MPRAARGARTWRRSTAATKVLHGLSLRGGDGRDHHDPRAPTAPARPPRCARSAAWSRPAARCASTASASTARPPRTSSGSASPTPRRGAAPSWTSRWRRTCGSAPTRAGTAPGLAGDFERVYEYFPVLAQRRRQQAGTLSGGEQQMLAVARAPHVASAPPAAGRAVAGPGPAGRPRDLPHRAHHQPGGGRERAARGAERGHRARPGRPRLPARDGPGGACRARPPISRRTTRSAAPTSATEDAWTYSSSRSCRDSRRAASTRASRWLS